MIFGLWNYGTLLLDIDNSDRPEVRTTLVLKELARLKVNITILRETRLRGKKKLEETVLWCFFRKYNGEEERIIVVGFAIKTCFIHDHNLKSMNDLWLFVYLFIKRITFFSTYTPTLAADEEAKINLSKN